MNILEQDYSDEDHVFVFNKATTHQKREEDALSATKMLKSSKEWGIMTDELDEDCNKVHGSDGKVLKMTVCMGDAKFANGTPQALYYPKGHLHEGLFKGGPVQGYSRDFSRTRLRTWTSAERAMQELQVQA